MGGYLRSLTARANGSPRAVRARVPSLFEPAPATAWTRVSSPAGFRRERAVAIEVTEEVEIAHPATAAPPSSRRHDVAPVMRHPETHDDPLASQPLPQDRSSRQIAWRAIEPLPPKPRPEFAGPGQANAAAPSATSLELKRTEAPGPPPQATEPAPPRVADQKQQPQALSSHRPAETALVRELRIIERSAPAAEIRRIDPSVPAAERPEPAQRPMDSSSVRPVQNPRPASPARPVFAEPVEPAAPSVQVVIGRVTVNAVAPHPAAAPAPPRPQPPRLSLEDYLKQREVRA